LLTKDEARRIAANVAKLSECCEHACRLRALFSTMLSIARMVCRPTIAMGNFVPTVKRNRRNLVAWQNNIAGVVAVVAHPCASNAKGVGAY
jgi:hypothetical protein